MSDGIPKAHRTYPYELSADELDHYLLAIKTDPHFGTAEQVSQMVLEGAVELWVYNDGHCILVALTRIMDYPDGWRELLVQGMSGTNVTGTAAHEIIHADMMRFALQEGCFQMVAAIRTDIWEKLGPLVPGYEATHVLIRLTPTNAGV
jgi:hypothetical protein